MSAFETAFAEKPIRFARVILGLELWDGIKAIYRAMTKPRARVAVASCHSSGKTHGAAGLIWWWLATQGAALITSGSWSQLEKQLWRRARQLYESARVPFGGKCQIDPHADLGGGRTLDAVSTNNTILLQGFHDQKLLLIVDEAMKLKPEMWEALSSARASGDVRLLALGNPTVPSGPYYRAFGEDAESWQTFTVDGFDTPNLTGVEGPEQLQAMSAEEAEALIRVPYLFSPHYALELWDECSHDPNHPLWLPRARGRFPSDDPMSVYATTLLERANRDPDPRDEDADVVVGLDPAGGGNDETGMYIQSGGSILKQCAWPDRDPRDLIVAELMPYRERIVRLYADEIGVGHGIVLWLEDQGLPVEGVNVSRPPMDTDRFVNLRSEIHWTLRERLERDEVSGLTDSRTRAQLAPIRWRARAGKIAVESKDEMKARGLRSPDRAEALMLSMMVTARALVMVAGGWTRDEAARALAGREE